jgi:hypothetical protein
MEAVSVKKIFALAVLLLTFSCGAALAVSAPQNNFSAELSKLFKVTDAKIDMFLGAHHRTIKEPQEGFVKKTCVWKNKCAKQNLDAETLTYVTVVAPGWKILGLQVGDKNGDNVKKFLASMAAAGWKINPDMGIAADFVGEHLGLAADLPGVALMSADMSKWFRVIYNADKTKIRAVSWGMMAQ